jgi:hypothetical protein
MILSGRLTTELRGLDSELECAWEVAQGLHRWNLVQTVVSSWSVGDHLEHLMLADTGILNWLHRAAQGEALDTGGRPSKIGYVILATGFIPRGKGTAPERTSPKHLDRDVVLAGFGRVRQLASELQQRTPELRATRARWRHPVLGFLSTYQWVRFAHVHHRHHRKIMADIMRRS